MAIKVYIHLEIVGYPEKTSKLSLPKGWVTKKEKTVADVIELFLDGYNKALEEGLTPLRASELHLSSATDSSGVKVYSDGLIGDSLEDRADYFIVEGIHVKPTLGGSSAGGGNTMDNGKLKCKNFGCNAQFSEEENHDTACSFHSLPPFFHDTIKGWQCCREKKVRYKYSGCYGHYSFI